MCNTGQQQFDGWESSKGSKIWGISYIGSRADRHSKSETSCSHIMLHFLSFSLSFSLSFLAFLASLQRPLERPHCLQQDSWTTLKLIYDLWRARLEGGCQFSFSSLKVSSISGTNALRIADLFWNSIWILATFENIDRRNFLKLCIAILKIIGLIHSSK